MKNNHQVHAWHGWTFDGERLRDPHGNVYTERSIRATLFYRQMPECSKLLIHPGCKGCPKAH